MGVHPSGDRLLLYLRRTWYITITNMDNILLQIDIAEKFLRATECNLISGLLGILFFGAIVVIIKQYKRNTALSDHIIESDKNNAVVMTELKNIMGNVLTDDKVNADKILTAIENLK